MEMSRLIGRTLKQDPRNVTHPAQRLLIRAGYVRETGPGLFATLPLFNRVLDRLMTCVRHELATLNAGEVRLPALDPVDDLTHPAAASPTFELEDRRSVRWRLTAPEGFSLVRLACREISSYKQLPLQVAMIQPVFRDSSRPRAGLADARERLTAIIWSLQPDESARAAACRELDAFWSRLCHLAAIEPIRVEGTSVPDEPAEIRLMIGSAHGPDSWLSCPHCGYASVPETAGSRLTPCPQDHDQRDRVAVHGPGLVQVKSLAEFLDIPLWKTTKTILFMADGDPVAVMVRGDGEVSEAKLRRHLDCQSLILAPPDVVRELTGADVGYAGPIGLPAEVRILADETTRERINFECGANRTDYHFINVNFGRDLPWPEFGDFRSAHTGEGCPRCPDGRLDTITGLELGRLTAGQAAGMDPKEAGFQDRDGSTRPLALAGCSLDLTRLAVAVVEAHHDEHGIRWPAAVAPAHVHVVGLNLEDDAIRRAAEVLCRELETAGHPVLFDDRDARAGEKFGDADLIGLPVRITISRRTLAENNLEVKGRQRSDPEVVPRDAVLSLVDTLLTE